MLIRRAPLTPRWANQQMAKIDLEMALTRMTSRGEMDDLHSLIRLVPLVSLAVDKAAEPWKEV